MIIGRSRRSRAAASAAIAHRNAGGEQVHGHRDARFRPVAELADALERAVDLAGDLRDESVTAAEHVTCGVDELVGVGGVR